MGQSKVPAKRSLLTGRRNVRSMLSVNTDACCELGFSIARSMNLRPAQTHSSAAAAREAICDLYDHIQEDGRPRRRGTSGNNARGS